MAHDFGEVDGVLEATLDIDNEAITAGEDIGVMGLEFSDAVRTRLLLLLDNIGCIALFCHEILGIPTCLEYFGSSALISAEVGQVGLRWVNLLFGTPGDGHVRFYC